MCHARWLPETPKITKERNFLWITNSYFFKFRIFSLSHAHDRNENFIIIKLMILFTYLCSHNLLEPYIENQTFHPSLVHDDFSEGIHCLRTLVKEWFSILCCCKWSMRALPIMPFMLSNYMMKYTKPFVLYI